MGQQKVRKRNVFRRMRFEYDLANKYAEKLMSLEKDERDVIIDKFLAKHKKDEPTEGFIPWLLMRIIERCARIYGEKLITKDWEETKYLLDGKYIVYTNTRNWEFKVTDASDIAVVKDIHEEIVNIYSPKDELIATTNNPLSFYDFLAQIKEKQLEGYYLMFKGNKIPVGVNGVLKEYPNGLFDKYIEILFRLI